MSVVSLPEAVRQLSCLAEIRGAAEAADLKIALGFLDSLPPSELLPLLQQLQIGHASVELPPPAVRAMADIAAVGADTALAAARRRIPALIRRLLEVRALTHDEASRVVRDFGILTLTDLRTALDDGRLVTLTAVTAERLSAATGIIVAESQPLSLGRALDIAGSLQELMRAHCPAIEDSVIAGDARRFEPLVAALVLVARTPDPQRALDDLERSPGVEGLLHRSGRRALIQFQHAEVDIRLAAADDHGTILFTATGSNGHVRAVNRRRPRLELRSSEADLYKYAGLPWIPPEMRNGTGEVEIAAAGRLPRLVERSDIRGDLHQHSTYSDGQDTIETMVAAGVALGYEYVAITDHSEKAPASRTVTLDQLARQREEIDRLRDRYRTISILHGIETEILPDGRVDFPDAALERLDIVLASLHDSAGHDGATLTRRCLQAIRHPLVNVISHPSNQLVGRRPGYALDYEAIYAAAAETGTALEIDGAPSHLDMDGEHARAAAAAGVTVAIDSDCHRARTLERQILMGIGTARRGWIEPRQVLNTRPVADVLAFVAAKRR